MREKLLVLIKNEGLTSSRLAELLGIQPSGISHILAGRNKPSFDFVQKILRRFPHINPDWLLLDSDQMYRADVAEKSQPAENTIFSEPTPISAENEKNETPRPALQHTPSSATEEAITSIAQLSTSQNRVKRIIVLFEDRTFESYEAAKKM